MALFSIMELDGAITLIPILTKEELRKDLIPHDQLVKYNNEDRKKELELENRL